MSNFAALIATIQANIKTNGNEEITGAVLQDVLEAMVQALGTEAINNLETALGNEEMARQNADGTLQNNIDAEALRAGTAEAGLDGRLDIIEGKIPSAASSSNKVTDKAYVDAADLALQTAINGIKSDIENGYVYAGIATPSGTPVSGKVFYLAVTAGTYTNFGGLVVTQGINILKYNGTAWSQEQLIGIDDVPTAGSDNLAKSGGVVTAIANFRNGLMKTTDAGLTLGGLSSQDGQPYDTDTRAKTGMLNGSNAIILNEGYRIVFMLEYATEYTSSFVRATVCPSHITSFVSNSENFVRYTFARVDGGTIDAEHGELGEIVKSCTEGDLKGFVPHPYNHIIPTGLFFGADSVTIGNVILFDALNGYRTIVVNDTFVIPNKDFSYRLKLDVKTESCVLVANQDINENDILLLNWSGNLKTFNSGVLYPYYINQHTVDNTEKVTEFGKALAITSAIIAHTIDTADGNRNVNYLTGEMVSSGATTNYANEIVLDGTEIRIEYYSAQFTGNYGYAFIDGAGNYVGGAKFDTPYNYVRVIDYATIKDAMRKGATKLRLSLYLGDGNTPSQFYVHKGSANDVHSMSTGYDFIGGTPKAYLSDMNTDGILFFGGHRINEYQNATLNDVYDWYDALVSLYPDWFQRMPDIGMDESNTYPIRHYTICMQHPLVTTNRWGTAKNLWNETASKPKRIILNLGTHCDEPRALLAGYLIVKEILESTEDWALWIKTNLIIDVVPVLSPWSIANGWSGVNVNDININRTFFDNLQGENKAFINLVTDLKAKGLVGCVDLHNTNDGYGYLVSKPSYWAWEYYCRITQRLQAMTYNICNTIFVNDSQEPNRKNHFHTWDASDTDGQLHAYMNSQGLLGSTIEVTWRSERFVDEKTLKGVLLEKTIGINLMTSFATYIHKTS